jgi:hypothetical protein
MPAFLKKYIPLPETGIQAMLRKKSRPQLPLYAGGNLWPDE